MLLQCFQSSSDMCAGLAFFFPFFPFFPPFFPFFPFAMAPRSSFFRCPPPSQTLSERGPSCPLKSRRSPRLLRPLPPASRASAGKTDVLASSAPFSAEDLRSLRRASGARSNRKTKRTFRFYKSFAVAPSKTGNCKKKRNQTVKNHNTKIHSKS